MATFVGQAMESAWPLSTWDGDDRVAYVPVAEDGTPIPSATPWHAPVDDAAGVAPLAMATPTRSIDEARIVCPSINPAWGQRITRVASYSSLADHEASPASMPILQYEPSAEMSAAITRPVDDDATEPVIPEEDTDDLPHGAATGTLLHAILEGIDYPAVMAAEAPGALLEDGTNTQTCIDRLLDRHPIRRDGVRETDRQRIARLVWHTLRTPMPFLDGLPLGALTDRRHELEFWLPAPGLRTVTVPDIRLDHTYLSGFIDLVFRHAGRYYVLDWKSNWSPSGDYSRVTLDTIMREHQYDLQYRIYLVALDRLLRLSLPAYDPSTHLGGVCYLFLRGVGRGDAGIYAVSADSISLSAVHAELLHRLGANTPTTEVRA
jgi:exodeoxyribonuclease V beta subunit